MNSIEARELPRIILSILICQAAGIIGAIFTSTSASTWYTALIKPEFTPPGSVISAVWIMLFTLMGISLFLVWREGMNRQEVRNALYIFAAQLIVNVLWSGAFFGLRSPMAGMIVIAVLWALILFTIIRFWPVSRTAAILLFPYILWVSYAAFLNYSIWRLNS